MYRSHTRTCSYIAIVGAGKNKKTISLRALTMEGCCIRAHLAAHFSHPVPNPRWNKCLPPPFLSNLRKAPLFGGEPYFGIERAVHAVRIPSQKQLSLILLRRSSLFFCFFVFFELCPSPTSDCEHTAICRKYLFVRIRATVRNRLHISYEKIVGNYRSEHFPPSCFAPTVCTFHSSPLQFENKNRLSSIGLLLRIIMV